MIWRIGFDDLVFDRVPGGPEALIVDGTRGRAYTNLLLYTDTLQGP